MLTTMNCEYRFFDIQHFFMSAEKNGFTTAELWCGPMHFFLDYRCHDSVTALSKLAINHGVHIVAICPQQTNPNPYNVAVRNIAARKRTYLYFCNAIDVAHELGANIVTITAGWGYLNESAGDALLRSIEMLKRVAIYAEKQNITIALEALQSWESNLPCHTSLDLAHILDAVGSPALRVCLDTGAMDAAGETIHDYFTNLGTNIVHCHFVDSGTESHVAWGDGRRNMAADLASLVAEGYAGYLSVETVDSAHFDNPEKADAQAMRMYRHCLGGLQS